jgi:hypothetical protein
MKELISLGILSIILAQQFALIKDLLSFESC